MAEVAALIDEAHMHGRKGRRGRMRLGIKVALRKRVDTGEHASLIDDEGIALRRRPARTLDGHLQHRVHAGGGAQAGELEEFMQKDRDLAQVQRDNFRKASQPA